MIKGINDDNTFNYEAAAEILNSLISINTANLAAEEAKACPDESRVMSLTKQRQKLVLERRQLDPADIAEIEHVLGNYASLVKGLVSAADSR